MHFFYRMEHGCGAVGHLTDRAHRHTHSAEPDGLKNRDLRKKKPLHGTHLRSRREAFEVFDPPPEPFSGMTEQTLQLTSRLLEPLLLGVAAIPM